MKMGSKHLASRSVETLARASTAHTALDAPESVPSGLNVRRMGDLFKFLPTGNNARSELTDDGAVSYVHYGDVHTHSGPFLDCNVTRLPAISEEKIVGLPLVHDGDLIMVDASEDYAGLGKSVEVRHVGSRKIVAGLHTFLLRPDEKLVAPGFSAYLQNNRAFRENLVRLATGVSVYGVSKRNVQEIRLAVPKYHEQLAIATALSHTDDLIQSLDRLIAKKQAVRLATMQELLFGRTRLPGFSQEWKEFTLGELADVKNGATPSTAVAQYWDGNIPWCTPTDITATPGKYLSKTERTITDAGLESCGACLLPAGSLLLCSRATIGEVKIATTEICTNQGFKSLVCKPWTSNEFLYYLVLTLKPKMIQRAIGTTFLEVQKRDVEGIQVKVPRVDEQQVIAKILSDMDLEIDSIILRRDKCKALKLGMMQSLLTGKVRLIQREVNA